MISTSIETAKQLMGENFIGVDEINLLLNVMGMAPLSPDSVPEVNFSREVLLNKANDYILVYGSDSVDISDFRDHFGTDPSISEPCLYNQDWYLSENFIHRKLENRWYLLKKDVIENTRAIMPNSIIETGVNFPSAILCVYTFFIYYLNYHSYLWYHDFVWCDDTDHNGDRIYVGKYNDIDGINKNGFSIHRHLALRSCYASVDCVE